uniref:Uncharacterized protein n=1 Tax=Anguilla anguilla TaxID=7936 RepID=A0A0E9VVF7_ANGAN
MNYRVTNNRVWTL